MYDGESTRAQLFRPQSQGPTTDFRHGYGRYAPTEDDQDVSPGLWSKLHSSNRFFMLNPHTALHGAAD
jgi:hypothetical protein